MRLRHLIFLGWLVALLGCACPGDTRFVTEQAYHKNVATQVRLTPATMEQLRKYGVTEASELKLEYFFYTMDDANAAALEQELLQLGYSVGRAPSAGGDGLFVITGWTTRMVMSDDLVIAWVRQMCQLGFEHDAEFDGWGTNPKQD